jgi:CRISPR/Cas system-associated endonuclease/helicase Cas3
MDISNRRIIISRDVIFDEIHTYDVQKTIPPSLEHK